MHQHQVGPGVGVGAAALERFFQAPAGDESFGAGDDDEVEALLRLLGGADFAAELVNAFELALDRSVEAAALGEDVVFDGDAGEARLFRFAHQAHDVDGVAEAVVAVGDDGERGGVVDFRGHRQVLGHGEDGGVGQGARGVDFKAARPDAVKARLFDELRGQAVVRAREQRRLRPPQQLPEFLCFAHFI